MSGSYQETASGQQGGTDKQSNAPSAASQSVEFTQEKADQYWKANLALLGKLLVVWFVVSYGCGILLRPWLDQFQVFGFKLGFWFAQQGSIYVFVALIFIYARRIGKIDRDFGVGD